MVARLPRELVEGILGEKREPVLLAARDPEKDALLDGTASYATHDGMGASTLDHRTRVPRPSTAQDLREAMIVADALDEIGVNWYVCNPNDEPPKLQSLRGLATMLAGSAKHAEGEVLVPAQVPYVMDVLAAASGGRHDPARPLFSIVYCPVSPLQHDQESLDAAILLAQQGVPVTVYSLALAGATSPVTLAGTVVQTNAEVLSGIVILRLAAPACPLVYVGNAGVMDMHSCGYGATGPEQILFNLALTELGHHYGFPVLSGAFSSDAKELCMQVGVEGSSMALATVLAGADLVTGMGMLGSADMLSLPKLVLDAEVLRHCRRAAQGIALDDEHVLLEVMRRVGPGGHFLSARETRRFLRDGEHMIPERFPRQTYEAWVADGRSETERATAEVERILAEHTPLPLPAGAQERIDEVIAAAAAELPER
jgi:trimethylamine--corrinoid protein Co-methyltransferase